MSRRRRRRRRCIMNRYESESMSRGDLDCWEEPRSSVLISGNR